MRMVAFAQLFAIMSGAAATKCSDVATAFQSSNCCGYKADPQRTFTHNEDAVFFAAKPTYLSRLYIPGVGVYFDRTNPFGSGHYNESLGTKGDYEWFYASYATPYTTYAGHVTTGHFIGVNKNIGFRWFMSVNHYKPTLSELPSSIDDYPSSATRSDGTSVGWLTGENPPFGITEGPFKAETFDVYPFSVASFFYPALFHNK